MRFKQWILHEMAHLVLRTPLYVGERRVASMDMMFETYPEADKKQLRLWMWHFSAKLPDGSGYLNFENRTAQVSHEPLANPALRLPDYWWDYAMVIFADRSIKMPHEPTSFQTVECARP